jgi:ABC-type lipoprotein export system ATPase subunit/GNAT superfamily N-acetyltransferase
LAVENSYSREIGELSVASSELLAKFDFDSETYKTFTPYKVPDLPTSWGIGVIVGASGSGKSTLLREFGIEETPVWGDKAVIDCFETPEDAEKKLNAVGLSSIPSWVRPYNMLSTGERFRADLARKLSHGAVVDEYTSVIDRPNALSASRSLEKFVRSEGLENIVIATCHRDVLPYLKPDWVIDTDSGTYTNNPRECLQPEQLVVSIHEVRGDLWKYFAPHHYLTEKLSPFARCFAAVAFGRPIAFQATLSNPAGTLKNAFRESRLVVHPDYQGFGIGPKLSDFVASEYVASGRRYFGKTAHPKLGEYRERSILWKPTSKNKMIRKDLVKKTDRLERFQTWQPNMQRFSYSHEYIGQNFR